MTKWIESLNEAVSERFGDKLQRVENHVGELTYEVAPEDLKSVCQALRDEKPFNFEQLIDIGGVDYLAYGKSQWATDKSTSLGYSRGVDRTESHAFATPDEAADMEKRFAVVYHLMSISQNQRLRLRCWCPPQDPPVIDSVVDIWAGANWFEREAFDLFGILFSGHPDLRRILTDYGFVGHPFRKDFPLIGNVEVRYDPEKGRVVYQPVSIEPRTTVPKVIRHDHQHVEGFKESSRDA
ncbi:NADH-quinone oxidoreductase subunit C [Natronospira proteinivora]|uniref:NADH-quinone oxidoreductase subunit C n=1 Tax=Natronospira proteinivora TaxID=1807133 RepID=A0ABT1GAN0_9GAMM|nr:NADH-quinone oxidoreductase subunit C [Natronospira proteinivora]MCP1726982.1 NADH-quinone oxidoreductase subunit C [Natronospira proteinivora]